MKSLMLALLQNVLKDAGTWCCTSTTRDFEVISSRVEHEGESFLTITLPSFCAEYEKALDAGCVDPSAFPSFRKRRALPLFLGGLLDLVFDRNSGLLLDEPNVNAIFFIRQITLLFKKVHLPCSKRRERKAFASFIECEQEVSRFSNDVPGAHIERFGRVADLLWGRVLSRIDQQVFDGEHIPKHGPGATADRLFGNEKYRLPTWTHRLEEFFPSAEFCIPNAGFSDDLGYVDFLEPEAELPVRVISVPKTLKTPRIIAIEPACMQYAQQSLMALLVKEIEGNDLFFNCLGFTDQSRNRDMARLGSEGFFRLATLDLSEASDRVSNLLVQRMLRNFPTLSGAIQASRTTRADVPGYGIIPLSKFASMGSATTFPIEAMVFLTVVLVAYERWLNRPLTGLDLVKILPWVRIYGDDIIVPVEWVRYVVSELSGFGLKVNSAKSFWTGKFRESCGGDYYNGECVTPTYCRRVLPKRRNNVPEMLSAVSMRNQFYKAGLWQTTEFLDRYLRSLAPLPTVLETSPVVGRHSFLGYQSERLCDRLHRPLVKGMVTSTKLRRSPLEGYGALLKFFLRARKENPEALASLFPTNTDAKHLERYGRPESVDIKIRWASAT